MVRSTARCQLKLAVFVRRIASYIACESLFTEDSSRLQKLVDRIVAEAELTAITDEVRKVYDVTVEHDLSPASEANVLVASAEWTAEHPETGDIVGICEPAGLDITPQDVADWLSEAIGDGVWAEVGRRQDTAAAVTLAELRQDIGALLEGALDDPASPGSLARTAERLLTDALSRL